MVNKLKENKGIMECLIKENIKYKENVLVGKSFTSPNTVKISFVPAKEIIKAVGGGYGQYEMEPDTRSAFLIREGYKWTVETTLPKRIYKTYGNWTVEMKGDN